MINDENNASLCSFCQERKPKHHDFICAGLPTMRQSLDTLFGRDDNDITEVDSLTFDPEDNSIMWDNSSGEYAKLGCIIMYCPFCGRLLSNIKEDSDGNS